MKLRACGHQLGITEMFLLIHQKVSEGVLRFKIIIDHNDHEPWESGQAWQGTAAKYMAASKRRHTIIKK